jgi:hypothetical protein
MKEKPTPKLNQEEEQQNQALLNELKEDLRRQKLENIVIDNGGKIIALAGLIVAITAGIYFYNQNKIKTQLEAGAKFYEIVENSKNSEEKVKALQDASKELPSGYASIAEIKIADEFIQKENFTEALKVLEAVSKNSKYDAAIREIAELKLVDVLIKQKENQDNILKRLDALSQPTSVFRYSALEMKADYFMANDRKQDAAEIYKKLAEDKNTPQNILKRVQLSTPILTPKI